MKNIYVTIQEILARQRAYEMHDSGCPAKHRDELQKSTDIFLLADSYPCKCWLAKPAEEDTDD